MRIAYITAGAGGMYCGSCLHDNTLALALDRLGHDVSLIPTYTPIRTDDVDFSIDQVFYGAVNVYLEQKSGLFRRTPRFLDRLLNGRGLLRWVSGRGSSVDPRDLGDMTLSVLQGEDGRQRKELERLIEWLQGDLRPDVVHITNSMFVGLARRIKADVGVPVVCQLQGEDIFLEQLHEPWRTRVRETLRERARDADAFVVNSRFYGEFMADYLGLPPERIHHIPLGLNLEGHGGPALDPAAEPFTIGYLARICPEKGLHVLLEAFRELAGQVGAERLRLRVAGWLGERDTAYLEEQRGRVREWGLEPRVELVGEVDREEKIEFLQSLHVLSVPTIYREPKGLFVLEALANGVPVVVPRHGSFPELVEATGGGLLVEPESAAAVAAGLRTLMDDRGRLRELGRSGKQRVEQDFAVSVEAQRALELYRACGAEAETVPSLRRGERCTST
jgi:glycosyltransferase involved in cell wall biosynthesis